MSYVKIGKEKLKVKESDTGRVKYHKSCEWCDVRFIASRKTAKYCSNKCKQSAYRFYK